MVDEYERKHGPCEDRTIFDGEFVVPAHLKNIAHMLSSRPMRLQSGLLGSLSRSRTFLTLQIQSRDHSHHSSVPDLSRSVPNTPSSSSQRLTLANSVECVLEENDSASMKPPKYSSSSAMLEMRRKSEQEALSYKQRSKYFKSSKSPMVFTTTPSHFRNNSEPMNRMIPVRAQVNKKPNSIFEGLSNRASSSSKSSTLKTAKNQSAPLFSSSMHNISAVGTVNGATNGDGAGQYSKWGSVRNSNSFASDLNINSLHKYTIPRVSLTGFGTGSPSHGNDLHKDERSKSIDFTIDDSAA